MPPRLISRKGNGASTKALLSLYRPRLRYVAQKIALGLTSCGQSWLAQTLASEAQGRSQPLLDEPNRRGRESPDGSRLKPVEPSRGGQVNQHHVRALCPSFPSRDANHQRVAFVHRLVFIEGRHNHGVETHEGVGLEDDEMLAPPPHTETQLS